MYRFKRPSGSGDDLTDRFLQGKISHDTMVYEKLQRKYANKRRMNEIQKATNDWYYNNNIERKFDDALASYDYTWCTPKLYLPVDHIDSTEKNLFRKTKPAQNISFADQQPIAKKQGLLKDLEHNVFKDVEQALVVFCPEAALPMDIIEKETPELSLITKPTFLKRKLGDIDNEEYRRALRHHKRHVLGDASGTDDDL